MYFRKAVLDHRPISMIEKIGTHRFQIISKFYPYPTKHLVAECVAAQVVRETKVIQKNTQVPSLVVEQVDNLLSTDWPISSTNSPSM
jgi:hypothetical protein